MSSIVDNVSRIGTDSFDSIKTLLNPENLLSNPMLYNVLVLFLAMYGPRLHPRLPGIIKDLFNNNYFRFVIILMITYLSSNNLQLALIISIAFCLINSYAFSQEVEEKFSNMMNENYSNFDTIREEYSPENEPENLDAQVLANIEEMLNLTEESGDLESNMIESFNNINEIVNKEVTKYKNPEQY